MAIQPEDRPIVIAVATQMWCARVQSFESRRENGASRWGYSPDMGLCVGEAAALIQRVDEHIAPKKRKAAAEERQRSPQRPATVTLDITETHR